MEIRNKNGAEMQETVEQEGTEEHPEIDCRGTDEIVCPYCGYVFGDSWEEKFEHGNAKEITCPNYPDCHEVFICEPEYSVVYYTVKKKK